MACLLKKPYISGVLGTFHTKKAQGRVLCFTALSCSKQQALIFPNGNDARVSFTFVVRKVEYKDDDEGDDEGFT